MFIARPDAELHALSFGQGPISLLAVGGWVASGEIWLDLFGHLPHWRCVALDHRGTGSTRHHGPITIQAMAEDLIAVADALQLDRCVLAAESSGAATALRAAEMAPGRFLAQVLVGPAWQRVEPASQEAFITRLRQDHEATLRGFIDACVPETRSASLRHWALQMLQRSSVDDAVALLRTRTQLPADVQLPRPALPTLILHGTQDHIVPVATSHRLAAQLPHAQLQELRGLGHVPIVTAPADMAHRIDTFSQPLTLHAVDHAA